MDGSMPFLDKDSLRKGESQHPGTRSPQTGLIFQIASPHGLQEKHHSGDHLHTDLQLDVKLGEIRRGDGLRDKNL